MKKTNIKLNNKVLIIILSVVVGILALGGIITAFILNYNVFSPKQVEILDDGYNVYISTTANDNYKSYRFKFSEKFENGGDEVEKKEIIIDSEKNVISLPQLLEKGIEIGKSYYVSTCYLSDNEGNNSEFSQEIVWDVYTYLSSPVMAYDEEKGFLEWDEVENADYYKVFYNNEGEYISTETTKTNLDLQTINGGVREFYVVAYSNNQCYRQSGMSNTIEIEVIHKFKEFSKVIFDKQSKSLTIYGEEQLEKINIFIDGTYYEVIDFATEFDEETKQYIFIVDISIIYNEGGNVGAAPLSIDKYNIFEGNIVFAEFEN